MGTGFRAKAVVFDKDGVLADSEAINIRSAFEVFRTHEYDLGPDDESEIVGKHPIDYVPLLARRFGIGKAEQRRMIDEHDVLYNRLWQDEGRLLNGAREALAAVRELGLSVGMATSSSRREVDAFLDRFGLAPCFDVTLSLDDVTRPKPDPEIYLLAARRLDVTPREMLVVEDSEHGVRAAKFAGATCVAVRTAQVRPERISMADAHIDSLDELTALLD
jgi:HAD superfamily hydrolase (TIGR01509 family)